MEQIENLQKYEEFLKEFDKKLEIYFKSHQDFLCCKKGCSACCEKGDYPISELELKYLMQGFIGLENELKVKVQANFKNMIPSGACPFLINNACSVYSYRPIVCRVHGLAYLVEKGFVKLPYCVNTGKNYNKQYSSNEFIGEPIKEDLDTYKVLSAFEYGQIKNLYDWINLS